MKTSLALVTIVLASFVPAIGSAAESDLRIPVKGFLCDTSDHAVQFADVLASGEIDELAKDRVGRAAGADVCGRYVGVAKIEAERVELVRGTAYKLTAFRFVEDQRVAWLAERTFAPIASTSWGL